jgi:4-hydroxybenzoate polyprenyltransferase
MPLAGKLFNFFVYSNLFIAGCAVLMVSQSYQLLLHTAPDLYFLAFVFFSSVCSYSFHFYLSPDHGGDSPRAKWQQGNLSVHLILLITGFIGSVIFFLPFIKYWPWLLFSVITTFLYSAPKIPNKYFRLLRKIAIGKTIFLAMIWMYVTTILPVMVSDQTWQNDLYFFAVSRFFMIYCICILFDYRDREDDKAKGIRSLVTYLSEDGIRILFILSLLLFVTSTICLLFYQYSLLTIFILLIPGIITAALYNYARENFSDIFYYFILDGLMALPALLTLLIGI